MTTKILNGRIRVACHKDILIFQDSDGFWLGAYDSFNLGPQLSLAACITLIEGMF